MVSVNSSPGGTLRKGDRMTKRHDPTEAQIARVLEKTGSDPRKLAIAYLRAIHRARAAETGLNIGCDLNEAMVAAVAGDWRAANQAVSRAGRRAREHKEHKEHKEHTK